MESIMHYSRFKVVPLDGVAKILNQVFDQETRNQGTVHELKLMSSQFLNIPINDISNKRYILVISFESNSLTFSLLTHV